MFCPAFGSKISLVQAIFCQEERQYVPFFQYPNTWYVTGRDTLSSEDQANRNTIEEEPLRSGIAQADILFLCVGSMDSLSRAVLLPSWRSGGWKVRINDL